MIVTRNPTYTLKNVIIETNRNDDMVTWCRCIKLDLTRRNGKFENIPHTPKWADGINRLHAEMVTKET